jgi:hypothetical protein
MLSCVVRQVTNPIRVKKRWSPSRTSVIVMCITTQRKNQPDAE